MKKNIPIPENRENISYIAVQIKDKYNTKDNCLEVFFKYYYFTIV